MPYAKAKDGTRLYYKDWGDGAPVVLIHGWPLTADSFDDAAAALANRGFRAIVPDRRGFGRSDQPWDGYEDQTADEVVARIGEVDAAVLAVLELYERSHKDRRTVLGAAERRRRELANAPS